MVSPQITDFDEQSEGKPEKIPINTLNLFLHQIKIVRLLDLIL